MKEGRFNLLAAAIIDCERRIFISCLIRLTVVAMTTGIFLSIFFSLIQSHVEMQYNSKWAAHCTSSPLPAKFTRQRNFSLVVLIFNVHRSIAQQTNSTPTANGERRWEEEDKSTCNWLSVECRSQVAATTTTAAARLIQTRDEGGLDSTGLHPSTATTTTIQYNESNDRWQNSFSFSFSERGDYSLPLSLPLPPSRSSFLSTHCVHSVLVTPGVY